MQVIFHGIAKSVNFHGFFVLFVGIPCKKSRAANSPDFLQDSNMGQEIPFWMLETSTVPSWLPMVLMSHITVPLGALGVSGLAITRVPGCDGRRNHLG